MRLTFMGSPALCTRPRLCVQHLSHRLACSLMQLKQRWTWFQNHGVDFSFYFRPRELLSGWLTVLQTGQRHDPTEAWFMLYTSCSHPVAFSLHLCRRHHKTTQCPCLTQSMSEELTLLRAIKSQWDPQTLQRNHNFKTLLQRCFVKLSNLRAVEMGPAQ